MEKWSFEVAHIAFDLYMDSQYAVLADKLTSYKPFVCDNMNGKRDFTLTVKENHTLSKGEVLGVFPTGDAEYKVERLADGYVFQMNTLVSHECCCMLQTSADFSSATAVISSDVPFDRQLFALNNCIMLQFAFASVSKGCLMVHASVIAKDGYGYLFLGRSGTGKSTHSRLWLSHIPDCHLLNDDNPILRIENGEVRVYGSPWSGKTPCYINKNVPVKGIVRLSQDKQNVIVKTNIIRAFAALLPSCSAMPWDSWSYEKLGDNVSQVVERVGVYLLKCRPDSEAAELCYHTISGNGSES